MAETAEGTEHHGDQRCSRCKGAFSEGDLSYVVSFGDTLWHVDCFHCVRCNESVDSNSNLLFLSDGSLVCENCSYRCSVCSEPILDEAIMTGDDAYHADCFRCKSCGKKIEELVFAKTTQGIWCMTCHNERVARSRKHAESRRRRRNKREESSSDKRPQGGGGDSEPLPRITLEDPPVRSPRLPGGEEAHSGKSDEGQSDSGSRKREADVALESGARSSPLLAVTESAGSRLSISSNKANNRRSGIYGLLAASKPGGASQSSSSHSTAGEEEISETGRVFSNGGADLFSGELFSDVDHDTRLFLDNVSLSVSPRGGFMETFRGGGEEGGGVASTRSDRPPSSDLPDPKKNGATEDDTIEYLNLSEGEEEALVKEDALENTQAKLEGSWSSQRHVTSSKSDVLSSSSAAAAAEDDEGITKKARDSICTAKKESETKVDIELVEELLNELQNTKDAMREISSKYTAFRRASRSAFEGFSMARQEYDKEVAARRETERLMDGLKLQLIEQALRLARLDDKRSGEDEEGPEAKTRKEGEEEEERATEQEIQLSIASDKNIKSSIASEIEVLMGQKSVLTKLSNNDSLESIDDLKLQMEKQMASVKEKHEGDIAELISRKAQLAEEVSELQKEKESAIQELGVLRESLVTSTANIAAPEGAQGANMSAPLTPSNNEKEALDESEASPTSPSISHRTLLSQQMSSSSPYSKLSSSQSAASPSRGLKNEGHSFITNTAKRVVVTKPDNAEGHSASVRKFKWGKTKEKAEKQGYDAETSDTSEVASKQGHPEGISLHVYNPVSILRPVRCEFCGDKMWGLSELRCTLCGSYLHSKCLASMNASKASCSGASGATSHAVDETPTVPTQFGRSLTAQLKTEKGAEVPIVVKKCVGTVAAHGMEFEGIYRKTGGMGQTKVITQLFEKGQPFDLEDQDKFNDIAAVTSCLKNYFRTLPDPLFTHALHEDFVGSVSMSQDPLDDEVAKNDLVEMRLQALEKAIEKLPKEHLSTISFLFSHLHQISLKSSENKMTPANLGVVFGPTLLRSRDPAREFSDTGLKAKVVELLVKHYERVFAVAPVS